MMNRIINKGTVPRGGQWKYRQHETGELITHHEWTGFLRKIKEYRRHHNIPVGLGFEAEIEEYVCEHQLEMCEDQDPNTPPIPRLSMGDVVRGLKVLLSIVGQRALHMIGLAENPMVDQAEANQRAAICAPCKYNVTFSRPCGGLCPELKTLVKAIIGDAKTPYDSDLRACGICHCYTASHVWVKMRFLDKGLTPEMREQFKYAKSQVGCWKSP